MAALPAVSKVVRVDHHFSQGTDSNMQFRTFLQYAGTLSTADAVTWLTNIVAGLTTNLLPVLHNTVSLTLSQLTDLTSTSSPQVQNSTGGSGTGVGTALPQGTALVIKHRIARRYRGGHPRTYLPGLQSSYLTNPGTWAAGSIGTIVGDYLAYIAAATANTNPVAIGVITHVNVSYFQGFTNHTYPSGRVHAIPTPRVTPLVDAIITSIGNSKVASQRRRNEQS